MVMTGFIKRTNSWHEEERKAGTNLYVEGKFKKLAVPVRCASKAGIYVDAATGRRLQLYDSHSGNREYILEEEFGHSKYYIGKTMKTYYARVYDMSEGDLVVKVFSSNEAGPHGLVWQNIFEARLGINGEFSEKGNCSLKYWMSERSKKFLGERPMLETPSKVNPEECIRTLWRDDPKALIEEVWGSNEPNMEEFIESWLSGAFLEKAIERHCRDNFRSQLCGVEIEFFGMKRFQAAKIVADTLGTTVKRNRYIRTYYTIDSRGRWEVTMDGSIMPTKDSCAGGYKGDYKCELVTPILQYKDIPVLLTVIENLKKAGMKVNDSCGVHVHVSSNGHTAKSLTTLIKMMAAHEELIFKALAVHENRDWACKKINPRLLKTIKNTKGDSLSMEQLKAVWRGVSRYHALNLRSVWEGTGIEFRMFNGTTNPDQVKAYIQFCLAISMRAKRQNRASTYSWSGSDDKTRMRQFLVQLGMTGYEFKSARFYLTANLKGNCDTNRMAS